MKDENQVPALYVYNYQNSGCLVLSAEYKHEPICAYLDKSSITEYDSVPGPLVEWFGKTVENIQIVRDGDYDNTARANAAWYDLLAQVDLSQYNEQYRVAPIDPPPPNCEEGWVSTVVGPLLPTTWGQGCSYNNLCPSRNCTNICFNNPSAWTGCVATSMAQVIRYWQPNNSYN